MQDDVNITLANPDSEWEACCSSHCPQISQQFKFLIKIKVEFFKLASFKVTPKNKCAKKSLN